MQPAVRHLVFVGAITSMGLLADDPEIRHYFESTQTGVQLEEDGLKPMPFGEYLVEKNRITREQLFRALCEQDRAPDVRIGEILAALGFVPYAEIDRLLEEFLAIPSVVVACRS